MFLSPIRKHAREAHAPVSRQQPFPPRGRAATVNGAAAAEETSSHPVAARLRRAFGIRPTCNRALRTEAPQSARNPFGRLARGAGRPVSAVGVSHLGGALAGVSDVSDVSDTSARLSLRRLRRFRQASSPLEDHFPQFPQAAVSVVRHVRLPAQHLSIRHRPATPVVLPRRPRAGPSLPLVGTGQDFPPLRKSFPQTAGTAPSPWRDYEIEFAHFPQDVLGLPRRRPAAGTGGGRLHRRRGLPAACANHFRSPPAGRQVLVRATNSSSRHFRRTFFAGRDVAWRQGQSGGASTDGGTSLCLRSSFPQPSRGPPSACQSNEFEFPPFPQDALRLRRLRPAAGNRRRRLPPPAGTSRCLPRPFPQPTRRPPSACQSTDFEFPPFPQDVPSCRSARPCPRGGGTVFPASRMQALRAAFRMAAMLSAPMLTTRAPLLLWPTIRRDAI
jgi:hypothetical protein